MKELEIILSNIEIILKARGLSANEVSRDAGFPDAIRNMRRKVRSGSRGTVRADTLIALARALKTDAATLATRRAPAVPDDEAPKMREFLLAQRALIDRQLAELDAAIAPAVTKRKRKRGPRAA